MMRTKSLFVVLALLIVGPVVAQDDKGPELKKTAAADSGRGNVTLILTRGRSLQGQLTGLSMFTAKTNFGSAEFPLEKIDGLKLHTDEKDNCIFAFTNGDLVTGKITIEKILVTTDWGEANVDVASIETIKLNPKGEFFQDSTAGKTRWSYGETREVRSRSPQNRPAATRRVATPTQFGQPSPVGQGR